MNTLKERFTKQCFCTDKALEATDSCTYDKGEILHFFRQELLALADEAMRAQTVVVKGQLSIEDYEYAHGVNNGVAVAAAIIRTQANLL